MKNKNENEEKEPEISRRVVIFTAIASLILVFLFVRYELGQIEENRQKQEKQEKARLLKEKSDKEDTRLRKKYEKEYDRIKKLPHVLVERTLQNPKASDRDKVWLEKEIAVYPNLKICSKKSLEAQRKFYKRAAKSRELAPVLFFCDTQEQNN